MAGFGCDVSQPPGNMVDSGPTEIKLFLGTQVPGGQEVTVNRAALQSLSPVFESMLTHDMVERNQGQVRLEHVSMETWNVISAFYFSYENLVCMDNVLELVPVADMYELTELKDHCDVYLAERVSADNLDSLENMLEFSSSYRLPELKETSLEIARKHFADFCQIESFLGLTRDVLVEVLSGPYIVADEHAVCLAVVRWLEAQNADCQTVQQLFQQLKLTEVCMSCLEEHVKKCTNAVVRGTVLQLLEVEKQARERGSPGRFAMQYIASFDESGRVRYCFPNKFGNPLGQRCMCAPPNRKDLVLIDKALAHCERMKTRPVTVNDILNLEIKVPDDDKTNIPAACLFGDFLVVTGKFLKGQTTLFYEFRTRDWQYGPPMKTKRSSHGMVSMGDAIYVLMGNGDFEVLKSIEIYRKGIGKWRVAGFMQVGTCFVAAATSGNCIVTQGLLWETLFLQWYNTATKTSAILDSTPQPLFLEPGCTFESEGAMFVLNGSVECVYPGKDGELSVVKGQLPHLPDAFAVKTGSSTANEQGESDEESSRSRRPQAKKRLPSYFIQHHLNGSRMNLVPLPPMVSEDSKQVLRP